MDNNILSLQNICCDKILKKERNIQKLSNELRYISHYIPYLNNIIKLLNKKFLLYVNLKKGTIYDFYYYDYTESISIFNKSGRLNYNNGWLDMKESRLLLLNNNKSSRIEIQLLKKNIDTINEQYTVGINLYNYDYHTCEYNLFYFIINHLKNIKYMYKFTINTFISIPSSKRSNKKYFNNSNDFNNLNDLNEKNEVGTHIYIGYLLVLNNTHHIHYFNSEYELINNKLIINHRPIYDCFCDTQWFNLSIIDEIIKI